MERTVFNNISIVSWNINGINNKINDPNFRELIEAHDVIFILETWLDKSNENIAINGYFSLNVSQSNRHKNAKRNSGGISVFIRNELKSQIKVIKTTAEHFIWLKIDKSLTGFSQDTYCCGAYIQPKHSPIYFCQPDLDLLWF